MILRDFLITLRTERTLEAVLLLGPRQVGKTTLLDQLDLRTRFFFDDLSVRSRGQNDPALLLENAPTPILLDEVQYVPNLFPELKLRIDRLRRDQLKGPKTSPASSALYYLTGSNRIEVDRKIKESLAGRCSRFFLHGLSAREILAAFPELSVGEILFKGGYPELYRSPTLSPIRYLNDYLSTFVEKDIAGSVGIEKVDEFQTVLRLLAARTGQFINFSDLSAAAGVEVKTVQSWVRSLERSMIVELVSSYSSNLSKRITKMKKLHFYDTGLCARLQGYADASLLWNSPHSGSLFESLVFGEIAKTRDNFGKDWQVHTWRTKEKDEIDFVVQSTEKTLLLESKLGIHGAQPFALDREALKVFKDRPRLQAVVTAGGDEVRLNRETVRVPIQKLGDFLLENL